VKRRVLRSNNDCNTYITFIGNSVVSTHKMEGLGIHVYLAFGFVTLVYISEWMISSGNGSSRHFSCNVSC